MATIYVLPSADTTVYQLLPCQNFYLRPRMLAGTHCNQSLAYMLLRFPVGAALPLGATLVDASLVLNFTRAHRTSSQTEYGLYRVLSDWSAARVTWLTRPPFDGTPATTFPSPFPGPLRIDVTNLAQSWANGENANLGLLIRGLGRLPRDNLIEAATVNAVNSDTWPRLRLDYVLPTPVIQPEFINIQAILIVPPGGTADEVQDVSLLELVTVIATNQGPDTVDVHLEVSADDVNYVPSGSIRTLAVGATVNLVADIFARYLKVAASDNGAGGATVDVFFQGQLY
jgi:hypothetical protein